MCQCRTTGKFFVHWDILVTFLSLGFDFFCDRDRIKCERGESALMKIDIATTTIDWSVDGHTSGLTLNLYESK